MNQGERDAAEQYQERKKREAQEKKDKMDAETWWEKNREKMVEMDVGKCHEYLKQIFFNREVRPKVHDMLYGRLCQWKGPPPPPPPPQKPSPPPRPRTPYHEWCAPDKHSTYCKKWSAT